MIVAKFIGPERYGFEYGKEYHLRELNKPDWKLVIEDKDDRARWCTYTTIESFLNHWQVIRLY